MVEEVAVFGGDKGLLNDVGHLAQPDRNPVLGVEAGEQLAVHVVKVCRQVGIEGDLVEVGALRK